MGRRSLFCALPVLMASLLLVQACSLVETDPPTSLGPPGPVPDGTPVVADGGPVTGPIPGGPAPAFIENRGQMGEGAGRFYARGSGLSVALGFGWMSYDVHREGSDAASLVRVDFEGSADCDPVGVDPLDHASSFLMGSGAGEWFLGVPSFGAVRYVGLWNGIDLELRFADDRLKYEFRVGPGADPSDIRLRYAGTSGLSVDPDSGDLVVETTAGGFRDASPVAFSEGGGGRRAVPCAYGLPGDDVVTFELGSHDPSRPLVIDPGIAFSTYLGTSGNDNPNRMRIDDEGRCYLFGVVYMASFPVTPGAYVWNATAQSGLFLARMDANLSTLELSAFIGLDSPLVGRDLALDDKGCIYLVGHGTDPNFPVTSGAFDTTADDEDYGFIMKLEPDATGLVYSTFIGGSSYDFPWRVAVDGSGCAVVVGDTYSDDLPTTEGALDRSMDGTDAGFLLKMSPDGSTLAYSTYIEGGISDSCDAVHIMPSGEVLVSGSTWGGNFPLTADAYDRTHNGGSDCYLMLVNLTASRIVYSTFLGGSSLDSVIDMAVDDGFNVYLAGLTRSGNFPTTQGAHDRQLGGQYDGFVAKFNRSLSRLDLSTYLGGSDYDSLKGIEVGPDGQVAVTGFTRSTDYPTTPAVVRDDLGGGQDAIFSILSPDGGSLVYSSYLGGSSSDEGRDLERDARGLYLVMGETESSDFPVTGDAYDRTYGPMLDGFICWIDPEIPSVVSASIPDVVTTGDPFPVEVEAHDNLAVANVTFEQWVGNDTTHGNLSLTGTGGPGDHVNWTGTWTAPPDRTGVVNYILLVRDLAGNVDDLLRGSMSLLDNDPPSLSFQQPPEGGLGVEFEVTGVVTDNVGLRAVNLTLWFGSDAPEPVHVQMEATGEGATYRGAVVAPPGFVGRVSFLVEAVDTSGNINSTSRYVSTVGDDQPPEVLSDGSDVDATTGDIFVFRAEVRDNIGVEAVRVLYWFGDQGADGAINVTMGPLQVSGGGNGTYVLEGFSMPASFVGVFRYSFFVLDTSGNWFNSVPAARNVADNDPPTLMEDLTPKSVTTGDEWRVEVDVRDNTAVSAVVLDLDLPGVQTGRVAMAGSDVDGLGNGVYVVSLEVPNDWTGPFNYTVEVQDVHGNRLVTDAVTLRVTDDEAPSVVEVGTDPQDAAVKGLALRVHGGARDNIRPTGMSVEYWFADGAHSNTSLAPDAVTSPIPYLPYSTSVPIPRHAEGPVWFFLSARDEAGNWASSEVRSLDLVNLAPTVTSLPDWTVTEERPSSLDLSLYVADGNDPTGSLGVSVEHPCLSCEGLVLVARFDEWMPSMRVTLMVSDGEDYTQAQLTIVVRNVNDAPVILDTAPVSGSSFRRGEGILFHANVTDEDGDTITLTWMDGTWLLGTGQDILVDHLSPGEHAITVIAFDGKDDSTQVIQIVVTDEPSSGSAAFIAAIVIIAALVALAVTWYAYRRRNGREGGEDGTSPGQ